ncbi:MAG: hypothetical protein KDD82_01390 [Planctomycetes bacterium]|nr:hypothetical protein [Planctomycetota bacterium]
MVPCLRRKRRAEGLSEYTILLTIVMVCSVVGLISTGSRALRQIAADKNLCQIEGKDCAGVEETVTPEGESAKGEEGETASEPGENAEGSEGSGSEGSDPAGETLSTNGSTSGGASTAEPTLTAWERFWGPLATNPMVMGFAGIMSWWI